MAWIMVSNSARFRSRIRREVGVADFCVALREERLGFFRGVLDGFWRAEPIPPVPLKAGLPVGLPEHGPIRGLPFPERCLWPLLNRRHWSRIRFSPVFFPGGRAHGNAQSAGHCSRGNDPIGKSVVIKGELSCSEDLYIDGQVEGTINPKGKPSHHRAER